MNKFIGILFIVTAMSQAAAAHEHDHMMAPPMPAEFETMKKLIGTWEGTADMGGVKPEKVTVIYELTSGGTAITEKLMPGTPQEMTSVYYSEGKSMAMTHYCSSGNHPEMKMKKSDPNSMAFEMTGTKGITSLKEPHMHALTLTMADGDSLKQEWVNYQNGKKAKTAIFDLKRKM